MQQTFRNSRTKRGTFVINIVETKNGYSIIQGTQMFNKPFSSPPPLKQNINHPTNTVVNSLQQGTTPLFNIPLPKEHRFNSKRINLITVKGGQFITNPIQENHEEQHKKSQLNTPKRLQGLPNQLPSNLSQQVTSQQSKKFAGWFNINRIHQKQQNMVITWMKETTMSVNRHSNINETQQFKSLLVDYKRHRNQIVRIYLQEYFPKRKYLTASQIRKYICSDACWLMQLQVFLSSWGIINSHHINFQHQQNEQQFLFKEDPQTKLLKMLPYDLSLQPSIHEHTKEQNQNNVLKKLTYKMRPYCDYCGIHCSIVWFQHLRTIDSKQIATIMKNVNSKNPALSDKQYQIILCTKCYCDGNFPLLLTHHDFKKISVNDKMQPNRKKTKKQKKSKKKQRKDKQRYCKQEEQGQAKENFDLEKDQKQKEQQKQEFFKQPQLNVNSMIEKILSSQETDKKWRRAQVLRLLQLIEQKDQDWQQIHRSLQQQGFCTDKAPQQIIGFFISLPKRGVSKINEQYYKEQFLKDNHQSNSTNMIDLVCQRALIKAGRSANKGGKNSDLTKLGDQIKKYDKEVSIWKQSIDDIAKMYMKRKMNAVQHLQEIEKLSKENLKIVRELYKKVYLKDL